MRILITGGPRTGKTTLGRSLALGAIVPLRHTDDTIDLGWSEASAEVARWISLPGPWVIEGVAVPRALRKWLRANDGCPAEQLIVLHAPFVELTPGQLTMTKGVWSVLAEIASELRARGTEIVRR